MNMKYPISVTTLFCLSLTGMAQPGTSLSALPGITINLKASGPTTSSVFSHFEVIDQRADPSRIGIHTFVPAVLGHSRNRQLVFPRPASSEIAAWLNKHFTRPGAHSPVLIILR